MITPTVMPDPTVEYAIRLRAYDLYLRRGQENGHDLDDWLEAESEILRELYEIAQDVAIVNGP